MKKYETNKFDGTFKPNLQNILDEGFNDTGKEYAFFKIYESEKEGVLYNPLSDKIYLRYSLDKEMENPEIL